MRILFRIPELESLFILFLFLLFMSENLFFPPKMNSQKLFFILASGCREETWSRTFLILMFSFLSLQSPSLYFFFYLFFSTCGINWQVGLGTLTWWDVNKIGDLKIWFHFPNKWMNSFKQKLQRACMEMWRFTYSWAHYLAEGCLTPRTTSSLL